MVYNHCIFYNVQVKTHLNTYMQQFKYEEIDEWMRQTDWPILGWT